MANLLIDSSFARRSPASNASYYASLFKAQKPNVMACSNKVPSRALKNDLHLDLERNRLRAAALFVRLCISFVVAGDFMLSIALI
ncbi:hypothetical protein L3X38_042669 [Prunus dulcis]|uniref:Uncharacterized protein n=1 Tax=Prunus dulcis TaxID=3755 RepID=A0AAD4YM68_PRUDU|nr:hypothetical protein L3X38_042669 [Prunus dulcis]